MAVPILKFEQERDDLNRVFEQRGPAQTAAYWQDRNTVSLDGKPTGI
jgi:hypothetical protein